MLWDHWMNSYLRANYFYKLLAASSTTKFDLLFIHWAKLWTKQDIKEENYKWYSMLLFEKLWYRFQLFRDIGSTCPGLNAACHALVHKRRLQKMNSWMHQNNCSAVLIMDEQCCSVGRETRGWIYIYSSFPCLYRKPLLIGHASFACLA